jgi:FMNH2-dependent dimethyl sulfone monooxygenase
MQYGVAAYSIIRNNDAEVKKELARITDVQPGSPGYHNYQQWLAGTQLEQKVSLEDYSVSNRGLRSGLVGTPAQVEDHIAAFEEAGVDFFLLQCSPQLEEMERFAETVIKPELV